MQDLFLKVCTVWRTVLAPEEGQDMSEYALTVALIALSAVAGMHSIAGGVNTVFVTLSNTFNNAIK